MEALEGLKQAQHTSSRLSPAEITYRVEIASRGARRTVSWRAQAIYFTFQSYNHPKNVLTPSNG